MDDTETNHCLKIEAFKLMSDLRLLQVDGAYFDGNFDALSTELKWLSWKRIPSQCIPSISHLRKLSVLDLSNSLITNDWNGWQHIQKVKTLKVLDLGGCRRLTRTPDFSYNTRLQRLILDRCYNLAACDESIGCLKKLVNLTLKHCENIKELPDSICKMSSLTNLILSDCHKLEKLPEALGDMKSLIELIIDKTDIEELPDSIGSLEKLVRLSAKYCYKLAKIPHSMGKLRRLQYINLLRSRINELPEGFGNLWSLKELKMGNVFRSRFLTRKGRRKFQSIRNLPLIFFEINYMVWVSMESLPNLSNFKSLERLHVYHCEKLTEIEGLNGLSLLQELYLANCKMLQSLPELPSSLIKLNIEDCSSVESLPDLSNFKNLEELRLCNWEKLTENEDLNGHTLLQQLVLKNCRMLQSLPELPPSLTRLDIEGCESMESLPNLSNLKILEQLCLKNCRKLAKIEGMGGLSLLKQLNLQNCVMLQSLPQLPPSLIRIDISYCKSMKSLPNLSDLNKLEKLNLVNCEKITKIEGLTSLSPLQQLYLTNCVMLQSLPELPSILTELQVWGCMKLSEIEGIIGLSLLKVLHLYDCRELQSLPDLSNLKKLEALLLERCDNLVEIRGLESLESLKYFRVLRCNTYIKTLQKCVAQGMLVGAFHGKKIQNIYQIPENDENIKGMGLLLVYQTPLQLLEKPIHLKVETAIMRNADELIQCCHDLQIEGMKGTDVDGYYSCYFHGLTWFGLPLRKQDIIQVTELRETHQEANKVRIKMLDIIPEYETTEDSQQLEKRIAPFITCTSVESVGVGRDKKPDDNADASTWLTLGGGEGQGPISCSQQREGMQRGNKRKWEHDDDDDDDDDDAGPSNWLALW